MLVHAESDLPDLVCARGATHRLAGGLDGRQLEADEDADDRDYHKQLHEREAATLFSCGIHRMTP